MEHLEVRHLGLVAGVGECLESSPDQFVDATAEDDLLTKEVGLSLVLERCLDDTGAGGADAVCVGEGKVFGPARGVLVDGNKGGAAAVCLVLPAYQVASSGPRG